MKHSLPSLGLVCACLTTHALAQSPMPERVFPMVHFWQAHPTGIGTEDAHHFTAIQIVDVHPGGAAENNPVTAAETLANTIRTNFQAGKIESKSVCVFIRGFGHDNVASDPNYPAAGRFDQGYWQGNTCIYATGLFLPPIDDRLGLTVNQFPHQPNPYPPNHPTQEGDDTALDARPWRQPFVLNATTAAPLAEWMRRFVTRYKELYQAPNSGLPDPRDYLFAFDTESSLGFVGSPNSVFIPRNLYLYSQQPGNPDIWGTWPVPGSQNWQPPSAFPVPPGEAVHGQTLAALWQYGVQQFGWPSDPSMAFNPVLSASHPANRAHMVFWYTLAQRWLDSIMKYCAYDILEEAWPGVRYCNFDASRYDGVTDTTGWYMDWNVMWPTTDEPWTVSNTMPRTWIDRNWATFDPNQSSSRPLYAHLNNSPSTSKHDIWLGITQQNSANVDSPYFYFLNQDQMWGVPAWNVMGHYQRNLYLSTYGTGDSGESTNVRLDRHTMESIINSWGGGNYDRIYPWVPEMIADTVDQNYPWWLPDSRLNQEAMLRAKNTPGRLAWFDHTVYPNPDARLQAWKHTVNLVKRVYAANIIETKVVHGNLPAGSPDHENSMLEYTLRTPQGNDYTLDLEAVTSSLNGTAVRVEFDGLDPATLPEPPFPPQYFAYKYRIFLEGSTEHAVAGQLYVWDWDDNTWHQVGADFGFFTPDGSVRRSFDLVPGISDVFVSEARHGGAGRMRLQLVELGDSSGLAKSRWDLLQVVPMYVTAGTLEPACCEGMANSEMNFDGTVDSADVAIFSDSYVNGAPAADLNLDDQVDVTDAEMFLNSLVNQTP